jgi:hypothetical protein
MNSLFKNEFFNVLPKDTDIAVNLHPLLENYQTTFITDEGKPIHVEFFQQDEDLFEEAEYHGRKVALGKIIQGDIKKFKVYVKDPKTGNVKKVNFGHGGKTAKRLGYKQGMHIKKNNPARRRSFRARHHCESPGPRTKARYWACRTW